MTDMIASATPDSDHDPFWSQNRADFLAKRSAAADVTACGTCRSKAQVNEPVEHDECQQRATLVHAPDHPYYEILAGFSLEENAKLPARFHVPVFDDCGVPNAWLCAVCQEEGVVTGWPCATAVKYGAQVFTPLHEAEAAQKKQVARIAELESAPLAWAHALDADDLHTLVGELSAALLGYWHDDPDAKVLARVEAVLTEHRNEATPDADFYQPGVTYTSAEFPQYGWKFRCDTVTIRPDDGERTALGWRLFKGEWEPYAYYEDDWDLGRYDAARKAVTA